MPDHDPDLLDFDRISDLSSVITASPQSSRLLSLRTSSTLSSLSAKPRHLLRRSFSALESLPKELSSLIHSHSFPRRFSSQRQVARDDSMNDLQLRPSLDMKLPCSHADLDERPSRRTKLENRIYSFLTRSRSRSRSKLEQSDSIPPKMHQDQRQAPTGTKPASRIPSRPISSNSNSSSQKRTPLAPKAAPTQQQQVRENAAPSSRPTTPKSSVTKKTIHSLFGIPLALRRSSRSRSRSRPSSPQPSLKTAKDAPPVPASGWYDDEPTPKARKPAPSPLTSSRNTSPTRKPKSRASDPAPTSLKLPKLFSAPQQQRLFLERVLSSLVRLAPQDPHHHPPSQAQASPHPSNALPRTDDRRSPTALHLPHPTPAQGAVPNSPLMAKLFSPAKAKESPPPSAMKPISKLPSPQTRHASKNASMDASYRYRGGNMSIVEEESSIRTSVRTSLDLPKPSSPSLKGKAREDTATPTPSIAAGTSHLRPATTTSKMTASVRSTKHGSFDFERPGWVRWGSSGRGVMGLLSVT
ncbi:hypothetical protein NMY22_g18435 [Coprinellus aureogranulatus]|nr:hypothetical protein NMY22_g18435 [Coprinellus aureogranulatus]